MKAPRLLLILLLVSPFLSLWGQSPQAKDKYWVFLTDKGDVSAYAPQDLLSPRALERRAKHGIELDASDYPVRQDYMAAVAAEGAELCHPSKWFNAVSTWMDEATVARVAALPFVKEVKAIPKVRRDLEPIQRFKTGYNSGVTRDQLEMVGLDQMHQNGYNGTGVLIALMDNGFNGVDENPYLEHLITDERLVATYDFVNDEVDVFNQGSHGTWVLSILAGWQEEAVDSFNFYGSAHGASFILCHTENDASETTQEEDNWVAAMEFADSAGADIFSTSLGYQGMDPGGPSYTPADMDGNTTIITRGADRAASKGIIVVNSAGNSGNNGVTAPADGDSVIAVGSVTAAGEISGFSSRGPTADGRLKPDICAMGQNDAFVGVDGSLRRGNGTSFSCPVLSGLLACALQARPETRNMEMYEALIRSAHLYNTPDNTFGYGIPSASKLLSELGGPTLAGAPGSDALASGALIYPNPAYEELHVVYDNDVIRFAGRLQIFDMQGKMVVDLVVQVDPFYNVFHLDSDIARLLPGRYALRLIRDDFKEPLFTKNLIIGY